MLTQDKQHFLMVTIDAAGSTSKDKAPMSTLDNFTKYILPTLKQSPQVELSIIEQLRKGIKVEGHTIAPAFRGLNFIPSTINLAQAKERGILCGGS